MRSRVRARRSLQMGMGGGCGGGGAGPRPAEADLEGTEEEEGEEEEEEAASLEPREPRPEPEPEPGPAAALRWLLHAGTICQSERERLRARWLEESRLWTALALQIRSMIPPALGHVTYYGGCRWCVHITFHPPQSQSGTVRQAGRQGRPPVVSPLSVTNPHNVHYLDPNPSSIVTGPVRQCSILGNVYKWIIYIVLCRGHIPLPLFHCAYTACILLYCSILLS